MKTAFKSVLFCAATIMSLVAIQTLALATAAQDSTAIRPFTIPTVPKPDFFVNEMRAAFKSLR